MFNDEVIIRSQHRFRSDHHKVCTEEVKKIALSSNDDKRIQTFDKVTTYPYGTNAFKVCEGEMLSKNKLIELDEDIDISKTEDIDISKTEDIDNTKTEDIDNTRTEDIDNTKIEDIDNTKTEDIDEGMDRDTFIQIFGLSKRARNKNGNWIKRHIIWVFGIIMYQNYVKSGYTMMVTMHTQGLKSFTHVLVRWFLLENIRQPYQKIYQKPT